MVVSLSVLSELEELSRSRVESSRVEIFALFVVKSIQTMSSAATRPLARILSSSVPRSTSPSTALVVHCHQFHACTRASTSKLSPLHKTTLARKQRLERATNTGNNNGNRVKGAESGKVPLPPMSLEAAASKLKVSRNGTTRRPRPTRNRGQGEHNVGTDN
jgi:hypothetical protein